jgi:outer membrane protein TolC
MIRVFTSLLLILLCGPALPALAQDAKPMSLQDCIDYALSNSDTIKNTRLNIKRQQAQNNQVKASALPQINFSGQYNYFPNPQKTLIPGEFFGGDPGTYAPLQFTPSHGATISLAGSQTLLDGGLFVALKARKTIMQAVEQSAKLTEEGLKYQIQRAYFASVIAQNQFRTLSDLLANARDAAHDVEVLYNTGFAERIDVDRSQVQLTNLSSDSLRTWAYLEMGLQGLKYLIGMDIDEPITLTDTALAGHLEEALELLTINMEYTHRTEYNLLTTMRELDEAQIKRYQYSVFPTLNLIGNMGYNYGSNNFTDLYKFQTNYLYSTLVGVQLNVPVFTGLRRANQIKEMEVNLEKTNNNIHQLKLALDMQLAQSKTALRNSLLAAEVQKRNLSLAGNVLDLARKKFKAGVGSNLEVNQAQTDLFLSQNNYYSALLDVVNAEAEAKRALGEFQ